ncbi:MAG: ATP-binding protein [Bacteroidales bacterium]
MVFREYYIQELEKYIDKPIIKVLTGIRRSGKSTILSMVKERLQQRGVKTEQIISLNFESFQVTPLLNAPALYNYIRDKTTTREKYYLLLDEIQEVERWEKAINSFTVDFHVDIILTGSNSRLLSSELSTYLAGRYVEIPVYTLSYSEYLDFHEKYSGKKEDKPFNRYFRYGGFPVIHKGNYSIESAQKIVFDIYSSVLLRDTIQRYRIRDIELLERVVKYVFDNIGNTFSGKNIADYFKSQQRKIDLNTVYNYLHALESSFLIYKAPRYDIKGKEILKTMEKYYLADISLLYAAMGFKDSNISGILENIVFLELKRRGYHVYVGKLGTGEIDFVADKSGAKLYIQIAYKLDGQATIDREFGNLLAVSDQYPKYVITLDDFWQGSVKGVEHLHITQFLLNAQ